MKGDPLNFSSIKSVLHIYSKAVLRYPLLTILMLVGVVGMQVGNVIAPLYLKELFNTLANSSPNEETFVTLTGIIGLIALWWGVVWVSNRIEHFANLRLISRVMADLIDNAFGYLIEHSHAFFTSNFAGSLTHKINKFARAFQTMYEGIFISFFPTLLFVCGAVVVLFLRHHTLGVALGVWVVLFVLFQIWVTNLRQPLRRARSEADTRITATLADAIGNQPTITLFSGGTYERKLFGKVVETWRQAGVRSWTADAYIWSGIGVFMIGIEVALLYVAVLLWQQGVLTIGDFVLIQAYLLTLFERLTSIQNDLRRFFDAFADGGDMVQILEEPHGVGDKSGATTLQVSKGEVVFKDVSFNFYTNVPVLREFNLTVKGGERVALVGPSGAGKTTVTKLLLRLYDIESGKIEVDGQSIADTTQNSLRNAVAFVPQEPVLFHRTLMDNIRYGRRNATNEEVFEAAKKARCHEFIEKLPQKYDTYVGERGVKLSGGERQRVAIARAILKNAPILVLDEATSSLDSESESLIQDALANLMKGKTVVVIAHRLSTIMKMDRIVVMEEGVIVAQGTHAELLAQDGLYKKLWSIQAGGFLGGETEPRKEGSLYTTEGEGLVEEPEEK